MPIKVIQLIRVAAVRHIHRIPLQLLCRVGGVNSRRARRRPKIVQRQLLRARQRVHHVLARQLLRHVRRLTQAQLQQNLTFDGVQATRVCRGARGGYWTVRLRGELDGEVAGGTRGAWGMGIKISFLRQLSWGES